MRDSPVSLRRILVPFPFLPTFFKQCPGWRVIGLHNSLTLFMIRNLLNVQENYKSNNKMTATSRSFPTPFYTRLAMILVSLIALGYIFVLGKRILCPLLFSFLFAIVLLPVSAFFEKKLKLPRSASSGL